MPSEPKDLVEALLSEGLITPAMARFIASDAYIREQQEGFPEYATESYIAEQNKLWTDYFLENPTHGISCGGYGYFPKNVAKGRWEATDGSPVKVASIADLMFTFGGGDGLIDFLNAEPQESHMVVTGGNKGQEDHELGSMRGDHR